MRDLTNDKRNSTRKIISGENATVEISLPYPKGSKIIKEVIDLSDRGFSFKMPAEEGYLAKGTPLKEIVLNYNDVSYPVSGEVAYVIRLQTGEGFDYKIGIQVTTFLKLHSDSNPNDRYRIRPKRFDLNNLSGSKGIFVCRDKEIEISGDVVNISSFGAAFKTKNEILLKSSQILKNSKIFFENEVVFSGDVIVVNIRELMDDLIVGISFQSSLIDLDQVTDLEYKANIKLNVELFLKNLRNLSKIDPYFKIEVMNIRFYLEEVENKLIIEEDRLKDSDLEKQLAVEEEIIDVLKKDIKPKIDESVEKIHSLVKAMTDYEHFPHKVFFQKNLHRYFLQSPYLQRVIKKPLGYVGDYEMINMMLRNKLEGKTLFAKLIHFYLMQIPPAQAVRNRNKYLLEKILTLKKGKENNPQHPFRILSIGSGPAREIQELLQYFKPDDCIEINLIDFDEVALSYSYEVLSLLLNKYNLNKNVKINYFNASIREILKKGQLTPNLLPQNIIFSTGLFDYLSEPICKKITAIAYSNLMNQGVLIIGNFSDKNTFQHFMEYAGDWYLIHRKKEDLLKVAPEVTDIKKITIDVEETGLNLLLNLERGA